MLVNKYELIKVDPIQFTSQLYRDIDYLNADGAKLATELTFEKLLASGLITN